MAIETLADGTVSIPVLEEQLVVEKRLMLTERLSSASGSR